MSIVIYPELLFVNDEDWNSPDKHDLFLKKLVKLFDYIERNNVSIFWNDKIENLLWCCPQLPPWLPQNPHMDILQILYRRLRHLPESEAYCPCNSTPALISAIVDKDIISPMLSLIHCLISNNTDFSFIFNEGDNTPFEFMCDCHGKKYVPIIIDNLDEKMSDLMDTLWPELFVNNNIDQLLHLSLDEFFRGENRKILYKLSYSSQFIKNIIDSEKCQRENILQSIITRLTLSQSQASFYKPLNDEPVRGGNQRRFRVTSASRIHYHYTNDGTFYFDNYYGESEHNKGL